MCGRFTLRAPLDTLARRLRLPLHPQVEVLVRVPRYNLAPTQIAAAVWRCPAEGLPQGPEPCPSIEAPKGLEIAPFRWGLVPPWADSSSTRRLINARAESVRTKPAFRSAFACRRCLVLADGFYEWQRQNDEKRPFLFERTDGQTMLFAGLWQPPRGDEPPPLLPSCTILTVPANRVVATCHDRMPAILDQAAFVPWLALDTPPERLSALLVPLADALLQARPVSRRVNAVRNDDPSLLSPD